MTKCYLSLGSNLGDKIWNIHEAIRLINNRVGIVAKQSSLIETQPVGFDSDNAFLNACIMVETILSPRCVLYVLQQIERELGKSFRRREELGETRHTTPYHDRTIDIDILLYGNSVIDEPDLQVPHPLMQERDFVMIPLREIL